MTDEELRAELERFVREHYEATFEQQRVREESLAALTDEEWWEQHIKAVGTLDPRLETIAEGAKEHMIEHRSDHVRFLNAGGLQMLIDAEVEKLMPSLIQLRLDLHQDGPLTREQYDAACMRTSQSQIAHMSGIFKDAVGRQTDPRKRDFMAKFASNVDLDLEDMKVLADPDITQADLDDVVSKINERMTSLTESLRPREE